MSGLPPPRRICGFAQAGAGIRKPAADPRLVAPPPFDRALSPADLARLRRLWAAGSSVYHIATALRLRYATVERLLEGGRGHTGGA